MFCVNRNRGVPFYMGLGLIIKKNKNLQNDIHKFYLHKMLDIIKMKYGICHR